MCPIIPRSEQFIHSISWQSELSRVIKDVRSLLDYTGNHLNDIEGLDTGKLNFPLRVPQPYANRIERGNPADPLLLQVLPLAIENQSVPGYVSDPLGEANSNIQPGIIHKYHGRVLLILAGSCAINCRYCFRRHFPYQENQNSSSEWQSALEYIRSDDTITEVILSGGEPLINSDKTLQQLTRNIADIQHIKRLRIHTRLPVVIPQRVTNEMLDWLTETRLQPVLVIHANHATEIDEQVSDALMLMRSKGITVLNQSVLLKGINDSVEVLKHLSERLFQAGVIPYYLHLLDKTQGTAHFDTPDAEAQQLLGQLSAQLPGYLVPKLVKEIAGETAKTPLPAQL
ncbi:MAG: EF-P beta-lysylation protein EpmB [Pseudomonadales bacterium]